jgi:alkanesulfonate monooxygenase SsuD/methylene tetrahydromethanopterin reductase-like flavin-dependent oxidoreductase (luciferase family)
MVTNNPDARRARDDAVAFLDHYYGMGVVGEKKIDAWVAAGPAVAVAERIREYIDAGCTTVILRFAGPDQQRQLAECVERVLPQLTRPATRA